MSKKQNNTYVILNKKRSVVVGLLFSALFSFAVSYGLSSSVMCSTANKITSCSVMELSLTLTPIFFVAFVILIIAFVLCSTDNSKKRK